jgi:hypothetical protein
MPAFRAAPSLNSQSVIEPLLHQLAPERRRNQTDLRQSLRSNSPCLSAGAWLFALVAGWLAPSLQARANCDAGGNITGANGSIVLGVSGCATASSSATVAAAASVANGISGGNASWTVVNAGSLDSGGTTVSLFAGGGLTNAAGGSITSGNDDVLISGGAGIVNNAGTITAGVGLNGYQYSDALKVVGGGTVVNQAGGLISGYVGVLGGASPTSNLPTNVTNWGSITSTGSAIAELDGGTITNNAGALVSGRNRGVDFQNAISGAVYNYGTITSSNARAINMTGGRERLQLRIRSNHRRSIDGIVGHPEFWRSHKHCQCGDHRRRRQLYRRSGYRDRKHRKQDRKFRRDFRRGLL